MFRLNRFTAGLLLLLLAPVALPLKLYRWLTRTSEKPEYGSTVEGDPLAYSGDKPLVVSLWATWASVWKVATEAIIRDLQTEFAGRCEFAFVEVTGTGVQERYGVQVVPAVLVFQGGIERARFVNLTEAGELRSFLAAHVGQGLGER